MKKFMFLAAALAVVSLASCGKGEKGNDVDSDTIVAVEAETVLTPVDTLNDSTVVVDAQTVVAGAEEVVPATPAK